MEKIQGFKKKVFVIVKTFPAEEKYNLKDQLLRSVRSVPTQIAEGHGRRTFPDRLRFCIIARGSLSETLNHFIDANDCKYINEEKLAYLRKKVEEIERLMNGYINYLEKQIK